MFWNFKQPGDGGHGPGFCLQRQTMSRFVTTLTYIRLCAGRSRFSSVKYALHFHRIVAAQRWRVACERRDGFVIGWKKKKKKKEGKKNVYQKEGGQKETYLSPARRANRFVPTRAIVFKQLDRGPLYPSNIDETSSSEINLLYLYSSATCKLIPRVRMSVQISMLNKKKKKGNETKICYSSFIDF